jgi:dUTP pyrophosphatase
VREVLQVPVLRLDPDLDLPSYARAGDAGLDLVAREPARLEPRGGRALIPTGIAFALPDGYAGFVQPRSGLARDHGVTCLNTPGLIDSGYRGEIRVVLLNTGDESFAVEPGTRIAQLVVAPVATVRLVEVEELAVSERGVRGFGSSAS